MMLAIVRADKKFKRRVTMFVSCGWLGEGRVEKGNSYRLRFQVRLSWTRARLLRPEGAACKR